jgi:hypothetical protein
MVDCINLQVIDVLKGDSKPSVVITSIQGSGLGLCTDHTSATYQQNLLWPTSLVHSPTNAKASRARLGIDSIAWSSFTVTSKSCNSGFYDLPNRPYGISRGRKRFCNPMTLGLSISPLIHPFPECFLGILQTLRNRGLCIQTHSSAFPDDLGRGHVPFVPHSFAAAPLIVLYVILGVGLNCIG